MSKDAKKKREEKVVTLDQLKVEGAPSPKEPEKERAESKKDPACYRCKLYGKDDNKRGICKRTGKHTARKERCKKFDRR